MNSFATLLHVLRHDFRHFRVLIALFVLLSALAVGAEAISLPREVGVVSVFLLRGLQVVGFALLVAQVFLDNSPSNTAAQWWTRPVRARELVLAKILYVALFLWLPAVLISLVGWWDQGFSLRQCLLAVVEFAFFGMTLALLLGALASSSASFGLTVVKGVLLTVGALAAVWAAHVTGWRSRGLPEWFRLSLVQSYWLIFLILGVTGSGWLVLSYRWRERPWWIVGVLLLVGLPFWMPLVARAPLTSELDEDSGLKLAAPGASTLRHHRLMGNVAVEGLSEDDFVVPVRADFSFHDEEGKVAQFRLVGGHADWMRYSDFTSLARGLYQRHLPENVRMLNEGSSGHAQPGLFSSQSQAPNLAVDHPGKLAGDIAFLHFGLAYVGGGALVAGGDFKHEGHRLRLLDVARHNREWVLDLKLSRPILRASRRLDDAMVERGVSPRSLWVLALLFPERREVELAQIWRWNLGPGFLATTTRSTRHTFHGVPLDTELPELHVFRIVAKGGHSGAFAWDGHRVRLDWKDDAALPAPVGEMVDVETSGVRDPSEANSLKALALVAPEALGNDRRGWIERAGELVLEDWEGALALAPWGDPFHWELVRTMGEGLPTSSMGALQAALERDPRLIDVVEKRRWAEAFRDYVVEELARRSPQTEPAVVRMGAALADERAIEDLLWHFKTNHRVHRSRLYPAIARLPGVDAPGLLRETWERLRGQYARHSILPMALEQGLDGALLWAVRHVLLEGTVTQEAHSALVPVLRKVTDFEGDLPAFYDWLLREAKHLQFDTETGRYQIPEGARG